MSSWATPWLRHLKLPHRTALAPEADGLPAPWQVAQGPQVAEFSAVAYHFAKRLRRELGVPVGLVNASWGGTQIESWMSREALAAQADIAPLLARLPRSEGEFVQAHHQRMAQLLQAWQGQGPAGEALARSGAEVGLKDRDWATLQAPGIWETQGLPDLDGTL